MFTTGVASPSIIAYKCGETMHWSWRGGERGSCHGAVLIRMSCQNMSRAQFLISYCHKKSCQGSETL